MSNRLEYVQKYESDDKHNQFNELSYIVVNASGSNSFTLTVSVL